MSEDDDNESDDGDDAGGNCNGNGNGTSTAEVVAGVPLAAAQSAASEAAAKGGTSAHKFMPPIEVELQMQQLWKHEAKTLDLIFSSGKQKRRGVALPAVANGSGVVGASSSEGICEGYRVFFIRALAVPPPRFRPPMHMGDMIAEHPQNVYLQKVGDPGGGCSWVRWLHFSDFCWCACAL